MSGQSSSQTEDSEISSISPRRSVEATGEISPSAITSDDIANANDEALGSMGSADLDVSEQALQESSQATQSGGFGQTLSYIASLTNVPNEIILEIGGHMSGADLFMLHQASEDLRPILEANRSTDAQIKQAQTAMYYWNSMKDVGLFVENQLGFYLNFIDYLPATAVERLVRTPTVLVDERRPASFRYFWPQMSKLESEQRDWIFNLAKEVDTDSLSTAMSGVSSALPVLDKQQLDVVFKMALRANEHYSYAAVMGEVVTGLDAFAPEQIRELVNTVKEMQGGEYKATALSGLLSRSHHLIADELPTLIASMTTLPDRNLASVLPSFSGIRPFLDTYRDCLDAAFNRMLNVSDRRQETAIEGISSVLDLLLPAQHDVITITIEGLGDSLAVSWLEGLAPKIDAFSDKQLSGLFSKASTLESDNDKIRAMAAFARALPRLAESNQTLFLGLATDIARGNRKSRGLLVSILDTKFHDKRSIINALLASDLDKMAPHDIEQLAKQLRHFDKGQVSGFIKHVDEFKNSEFLKKQSQKANDLQEYAIAGLMSQRALLDSDEQRILYQIVNDMTDEECKFRALKKFF